MKAVTNRYENFGGENGQVLSVTQRKKDRISSIFLQKGLVLRQNKYYYSLIPSRYHENISL